MTTRNIRTVLQALPLLLPLNIYMIGDWLGTGLQWALVRYQQTYYGTSTITLVRDLGYVFSGIMTGRSAAALIVWGAAASLLIGALLFVLYAAYGDPDWDMGISAPLLTMLAGVLFLVSCMLQYGIFLNGPAGFTLPLGVPLLLVIGWWTYRMDSSDVTESGEDQNQKED